MASILFSLWLSSSQFKKKKEEKKRIAQEKCLKKFTKLYIVV